jgi:hypothetical protein
MDTSAPQESNSRGPGIERLEARINGQTQFGSIDLVTKRTP